MVEEETRRYRPTKNYLEHLPPLKLHEFETDIIKAELERLQARTPMDMISMKRFVLNHAHLGEPFFFPVLKLISSPSFYPQV